MQDFKKLLNKNSLSLILLIAVSLCLRLYHLSFQSFWLDEIHTAREASMGVKELLAFLDCCDTHPPLFYFTEKIIQKILGDSEFFARLPSALIGTFSVYGIYLLGKELFDKRVGFIAALFTCFNSFHIQYSQEARPYIFIFCFVTFSFLYLHKFLKTYNLRTGIIYSFFTLLSLYFHYFSIFILIAQIAIFFIAWLAEKEFKKKFFLNLLFCGAIILLLFSFQIKHLFSINNLTSIWIEKPKDSFLINLVGQFFGSSYLLLPFVIILFLSGFVFLIVNSSNNKVILKNDRSALAFLIFICWVFITFIIPYLRSILVVPMLVERYFISILPVFLLLLSIGTMLIKSNVIRYSVISFFCLFSIIDIFFVNDYYNTIKKTQFRELAQFVTSYKAYPLNAPLTSWHQRYYLGKFNFKETITGENSLEFNNSILEKSNTINGFWLTDAHGAGIPNADVLKSLDAKYELVASKAFYDSWGMLFMNKKDIGLNYNFINYKNFDSLQVVYANNERVIPIWNNVPVEQKIKLSTGKYKVEIISSGDSAKGLFPHLNFKLNEKNIGNFYTKDSFYSTVFIVKIDRPIDASLSFYMDNDFADKISGKDRNAYVKSILFLKE